ncbi:MAG: TIGR01777 family protein [Candidatus Abyssobacteria bacterium SURF_17]|uniref:TIGR01777 family protein n=1 Tax=Candidatus Abyssobacteria bacterium SURF_17 TaxID=2093361 RepID=A0A419ERD5_9BACT|nr:MAG: TIGR01777 family protein [Candidatus Abyssubacteria bacterium SURF_17]
MKALITGGLGFVGTQLCSRLLKKGHAVTIVDHSPRPHSGTPPEVKYVAGDTTARGSWQDEVGKQDAIINLAGASIFRRWTDETKKLIHDSRVLTTRNVVEAMAQKRDVTLCSASAVGYYGFRGDEEVTEKGKPGDDFLARLCSDWENEAHKASRDGARVVVTRFGIVLGKTGGALGQMIPAFKWFVGGPLGSGNQWFSWIHMEDLLGAILFVLEKHDLEGPVNLCSPNPVRNKELAKALGKILGRPSFLKAPGFMIRAILGEFGSVLLEGQRVIPDRLLKEGFAFHYPELTDALQEVVGKKR